MTFIIIIIKIALSLSDRIASDIFSGIFSNENKRPKIVAPPNKNIIVADNKAESVKQSFNVFISIFFYIMIYIIKKYTVTIIIISFIFTNHIYIHTCIL